MALHKIYIISNTLETGQEHISNLLHPTYGTFQISRSEYEIQGSAVPLGSYHDIQNDHSVHNFDLLFKPAFFHYMVCVFLDLNQLARVKMCIGIRR